jgi:cellulose synthase/poly-beta-1,6-N-acetylglucosamine synthase-like glycosyltransferase
MVWTIGGGLIIINALVLYLLHRRIHSSLEASQNIPEIYNYKPVSIIKPVWGKDEFTEENFKTWGILKNSGINEIIFSFQEANDPALASAENLKTRSKKKIIVNAVREGFNGKMSNLYYGMQHANNDVLIFSDSDTGTDASFCGKCLYLLENSADIVFGLPIHCKTGNVWARIFANLYNVEILGFLAPAILKNGDTGIGLAVAMNRETLKKIGGVEAFKNTLADGRYIGRKAKDLGLRVKVGPEIYSPIGKMSYPLLMDKLTRAILFEKSKGSFLDTIMYRILYTYVGFLLAAIIMATIPLFILAALAVLLRLIASSMIWAKATGEKRILFEVFVFDLLIMYVYFRSFFHKKINWGGRRYIVSEKGDMATDK